MCWKIFGWHIIIRLELCAGADVVFLALHGACGEDGRIQAALDLLGVPYTGSGYLGSAIAMDKDLTKRLVADKVTTPKWQTVTVTEENLDALTAETQLPVVVKPIASGSSIGVFIAQTRQELRHALTESMPPGRPHGAGAVYPGPGDPGGRAGRQGPALH